MDANFFTEGSDAKLPFFCEPVYNDLTRPAKLRREGHD